MCKASQKSGSNYDFKAKLSDFSKLQQLRITYKDLEASTYSVFLLASINPSHSITWCRRFFSQVEHVLLWVGRKYHLTLSSDKMSRLSLYKYAIFVLFTCFLLHFLYKMNLCFNSSKCTL